jgi:serine/threonine protein kinase
MAEPVPRPDPGALSAALRHDRICDRFETALRSGLPARIEDHLSEVPADEQPLLFAELLRIEREFRGINCTPEEYRARFPDYGAQIDTAFGATLAILDTTPQALATTTDMLHDPEVPVIPGYDLLGRLDAGGMGVIYKALHRGLGMVVALKVVRGAAWDTPQALARFQAEARAVAGLSHPNVVRVYDYGEWRPTGAGTSLPYFTMEFVEGGSLAKKLGGRPLAPRPASELVETLARAMHYVHEKRIVHRDLKPANVLLAQDGTPKIADFGLAKRLESDPRLTTSRSVLGTASYMAPEQAAGRAKEVGPPTDVYALGAILYECLTGRPPFREESHELTINKLLTDDPVPPRQLQRDIPPELEAVCLKCLEKEPAQRYTSAAALADDLGRFHAGQPLTVGTADIVDRHARWARRIGYEILELLGCGRLSFVYKARQLRIERVVTMKLLGSDAPSEAAKARFRREAEAIARLYHPHIVQLYDFGEHAGWPYYIMEFVDGGNLSTQCVDAPLPPRRAAELLDAIARAAHYAHEQGIIHGGLQPSNIVLTASGSPKIAGFGIVQRLREREAVVGLLPEYLLTSYLAPELAEGHWDQATPATDVYALGAILYRMLTGHPPYLADSLAATKAEVLTQPPVAPRRHNPEVPADLESVCLKCLAKDPAQRYSSAAALAEDVQRFLRGRPLADMQENMPAAAYQLRVIKGRDKDQVFPLPPRRLLIGRSPESDIVLYHQAVSRSHCAVNWDGERNAFVLIDFASRTGVFLNDERVTGTRDLTPGDVIGIAGEQLCFESCKS